MRLSRKEQLKEVLAARAGDETAYARLYEIAAPVLRRSLFPIVGEADLDDVVQEAMIKALTKLDMFDGNAAFVTWAVAIGRNEALGKYRKNASYRRLVPASIDATVRLADGRDVPLALPGYEDRTVERKLAYETVHRALGRLKADERLAMGMKLDGHSNEEIANRLDKSIPAIKSIIFRARRAMSGCLLARAA